MEGNIKRIIVISIIVLINIILIGLVINSMNIYIDKIEKGQINEMNQAEGEIEQVDVFNTIQKSVEGLKLQNLLKIILLLVGIILLNLTIVIFVKIR